MSRKKILFFSSEPGGAEVLIPMIGLLREHGYDVSVMSHGYASERFMKKGVAFSERRINSPDSAFAALQYHKPDYLITSATSLPWKDMSEKYLWDTARRAGICTMAFIDQWQNYSLRFMDADTRDRMKYMPDHINCINDIGRSEMLEEGFPEERLVAFGHPSLADVAQRYAALDADAVLSALGIAVPDMHREETLVFVSEPLLENYGNSRGYNQYEALDHFLKNVMIFQRKRTRVIIKLHPKDDPGSFRSVPERYGELDIHIVRDCLSSLECLTLSDRIFGMTSIMLIEAFLLGKAVVSVQPGLKDGDPLILSRQKLIPRIDDFTDFDPFIFERSDPSRFPVHFDRPALLEFIERNAGAVPFPSSRNGRGL